MALVQGARLGPYEVLGALGAGGMGEVYRARDTRLGRDVALKVLAELGATDGARRARFEQEARAASALNHPGIVVIYDVGGEGDALYAAMELVEGKTLRELLADGGLPFRRLLEIAAGVADALAKAHESGIVHRDLKPENLIVSDAGHPKILDFGLAKVTSWSVSPGVSELSTREDNLTTPGSVLGTVGYMSPEQARGEAIDFRSDQFSFGVILYEMVTGRRAFKRDSRPETLAAILRDEPQPVDELRPTTPAPLRWIVERCLSKDPRERYAATRDLARDLSQMVKNFSETSGSGANAERGAVAAAPTPTGMIARARAWPVWVGGSTVGLAAGLGLSMLWLRTSTPGPPTRLTFSMPADTQLLTATFMSPRVPFTGSSQHLALAPDGRRIAFVGASRGGIALYLRDVGEIEAKLIPDTESAVTPFFSPDGHWLGFSQGSRLMKVAIDGGPAEAICDIPGESGSPGNASAVRGASWGRDGNVIFSPASYAALWRVPAAGGIPRPLTTLDRQKGESSHRWPQVLPDGKTVLFTICTASFQARDARVGLASLASGEHRGVLEGTGFARYSPTGHILYAAGGSVLAVPFDVTTGAVTGQSVAVLGDVQMILFGHLYADLDVSSSGALIYVPGAPRLVEGSLLWVDREGRTQPLTPIRRSWNSPRLSPDGRRLAVGINSDVEDIDIWLLDLDRDAWTRVTSGGGFNLFPAWSPDGRRLAFTAPRSSGVRIMTVPTDGSRAPEQLGEPFQQAWLDEWSPGSGESLLFHQQLTNGEFVIGAQALAGGPPRSLLSNTFMECCAALSPDGNWMTYVSNETGSYEVYLQPFPVLGEKHRVSTDGGLQPRWSRDGRELFYRSTGERPKIMAVAVQVRGGLRLGRPKPLFDDVYDISRPHNRANYDVGPDGRFLFVEQRPDFPPPRQLVLIPDFSRELREKLRAGR
jgi:eukaryotic-like serine/threonine-protein kinase